MSAHDNCGALPRPRAQSPHTWWPRRTGWRLPRPGGEAGLVRRLQRPGGVLPSHAAAQVCCPDLGWEFPTTTSSTSTWFNALPPSHMCAQNESSQRRAVLLLESTSWTQCLLYLLCLSTVYIYSIYSKYLQYLSPVAMLPAELTSPRWCRQWSQLHCCTVSMTPCWLKWARWVTRHATNYCDLCRWPGSIDIGSVKSTLCSTYCRLPKILLNFLIVSIVNTQHILSLNPSKACLHNPSRNSYFYEFHSL